MLFNQFPLKQEILVALEKKGFEQATPIQAQVIPYILENHSDLIGKAQTGTGKTAAFGLPILQLLQPTGTPQVLVLLPTRELAQQVAQELYSLKGSLPITITTVYGGQSISEQIRALKKKTDIVVGTPGRVIDLMNRGNLHFEDIKYFVLDEADEMLNMGFLEDVELIFKNMPEDKLVMLFSATMPLRIKQITHRYMNDPKTISVQSKTESNSLTEQIYVQVEERYKLEALTRILDLESHFYGVIFCRTKVDAEQISNKLKNKGHNSAFLHGDITQNTRESILKDFKNKKITILVATDLVARGIDIQNLTHVINYSLPQDAESYIHRIGRTGRAGQQGTAITLVTRQEYRRLVYIQKITKANMRAANIPTPAEIIEKKQAFITQQINNQYQEDISPDFLKYAEQLLQQMPDHKQLLSALLSIAFRQDLDASNYAVIQQYKGDHRLYDESSTTRLFISSGSEQGYSVKKLLDTISDQVSIDLDKIFDIQIFENFSFISAPLDIAEQLLQAFNSKKNTKDLRIQKALDKKSRSSSYKKPHGNRAPHQYLSPRSTKNSYSKNSNSRPFKKSLHLRIPKNT